MLFTVVNHIQESHFLKFHPEILSQTWHASPDDLRHYCYVLEELFNVSELFIKKIGLKKSCWQIYWSIRTHSAMNE